MRPSASASGTVSTSCTAVTRAAMMPTASSTDIIGPPNAKQSSDNCAIWLSGFRRASRQQVVDEYRGSLHHSRDRRDVIEMGDRQRGFQIGVGGDADDTGIAREQRSLAIGEAMHLDLAMRLGLETFDDDQIDPRQLGQQFRQPRLGGAAQFMHQGPSLAGRNQHFGSARLPVHPGILAGYI